MIRTAVVGLWVCAMTVVGGYFGTKWQSQTNDNHAGESKIAPFRMKPLSIPVFKNGDVSGYIVCRFSYLASAETIKGLAVKPDAFVMDAAFSSIYTGRDLDIAKLNKDSWQDVVKSVKTSVNGRYGRDVLHDLVLDEFTFVAAEMARRGRDGKERAAESAKKGEH